MEQFKLELEFFGLLEHQTEWLDRMRLGNAKKKAKANCLYADPRTLRQKCWNFFNDPGYSVGARIWAITDVSC